MSGTSRQAFLIHVLAQLLAGSRRVAVGAQSPIPGSAAFLARELQLGPERITVLGSRRNNDFTEGGRELFDRAAQGRIDAFFLGGGQIDGQANINLVGIGDYPQSKVRFPGSFGSSYLYFLIPKVILFREEHTPRTLVDKVDFISAPGLSEPGTYRPGGPAALVTGRCVFTFDRDAGRFTLKSVHPWSSLEEVREQTGFAFYEPTVVPVTPEPDERSRDLINGPVRAMIAETYPTFATGLVT
ncbi:MAG: CoA-transferase [Alphaproteobacteria bacterium]|nr:CoA synthetase [Rhodospirillaceae bacterium]MBT6511063.1 CoA synthetase [Rhodospirillaceae bacterium]MBT7646998.1 CoA synthetase [Rhodospirillaceae bacterium]MDG2481487.1 CoA-transferase [Alphaproteobacteria bacterium]